MPELSKSYGLRRVHFENVKNKYIYIIGIYTVDQNSSDF